MRLDSRDIHLNDLETRSVGTRDNHFLPQFYLRRFAPDSDQHRIYRFERQQPYNITKGTGPQNPSLVSIKNAAAVEVDLYSYPRPDGTIDRTTYELALKRIEDAACPILMKLWNRQMITGDEKAILTRFIVQTKNRVPAHSDDFKLRTPSVLQGFKDRSPEAIEEMVSTWLVRLDVQEEDSDLWRSQLKELYFSTLREMDEHGPSKKIQLETMLVRADSMLLVQKALNVMRWQFFTAPPDSYFVTSDNPVFIFKDGIGFQRPYSELVFPISKYIALVASYHNVREGFVKASSQRVKEIVRRVISNATSHVFSPRPERWVCSVLNKRAHRHGLIYDYSGDLDDVVSIEPRQ